jgi:CheY-like chemotaxis protein
VKVDDYSPGLSDQVRREELQLRPLEGKEPQEAFVIVDDSELNLRLLTRYLQLLGLPSPVAFTSGFDALHWLIDRLKQRVAGRVTLLTDLAMPQMDGATLVHLWRQHEAATPGMGAARVIIISASHLEASPPGVDAVLEKPLTLERLKRQLAGDTARSDGGAHEG